MAEGDLSEAMDQEMDPTRLMQRVTDRTLELIGPATAVMVGVVDVEGVTYVSGAGYQGGYLGTRVSIDSSLSGLAVRSGVLQRSDDTGADPRVDGEACRRLSVASLVCVPLRRSEETVGVLAVNADRVHAFSDHDIATLTALAEFVSVVIGSALDLFRVSRQLLEFEQSRTVGASLPGPEEEESRALASRYVMSVLNPDRVTRIDASERIRKILDNPSHLDVVFQPIVDLRTGEAIALEALSRFDMLPYRPPNVWFEEAHRSGLGVTLELLAIRAAVANLLALPEGVALSVNVSPETLMSPGFEFVIAECPSERLVLELTEHTMVDDYRRLIRSVSLLRETGKRIAVDDTGAGYSSLSHILKLAPDFIKLDRELVSTIDIDPVRRALAASLVTFAVETGTQIVAEGVETEDELESLERLGVGYAQGFHLGRPAPITDLTQPKPRPS